MAKPYTSALTERHERDGYSFVSCQYSIVRYVVTAWRDGAVAAQGRGRSPMLAAERCLASLPESSHG
jgi:hypothetical protein